MRGGDRDRLRQYGNPLDVLGDVARASVCAAPGRILMAGDFGAIESRVLAWLSNETWKIETYRDFDRTNDKSQEPYRIVAAKMLGRDDLASITKAERAKGKAGDLACGFGGSVGAWRRIASDDKRTDEEIFADVRAWRDTHPKTTDVLARARARDPHCHPYRAADGRRQDRRRLSRTAISTSPYPPADRSLTRRRGWSPANSRTAPPDVVFKDNARGKWSDYRGWFGTFIENVVQGTARDLLAAALERFEARGIPIVLHVHDEAVAEVVPGSITEGEFLAILLEAPDWAAGLPLAGKVWSGQHYFEPPEEPPTPPSNGGGDAPVDPRSDDRGALADAAARSRGGCGAAAFLPISATTSPRCSTWSTPRSLRTARRRARSIPTTRRHCSSIPITSIASAAASTAIGSTGLPAAKA